VAVGDGKGKKQKPKKNRLVMVMEIIVWQGHSFFITCLLLSYFESSWSLGLGNE
jgi:hypothetical protein